MRASAFQFLSIYLPLRCISTNLLVTLNIGSPFFCKLVAPAEMTPVYAHDDEGELVVN